MSPELCFKVIDAPLFAALILFIFMWYRPCGVIKGDDAKTQLEETNKKIMEFETKLEGHKTAMDNFTKNLSKTLDDMIQTKFEKSDLLKPIHTRLENLTGAIESIMKRLGILEEGGGGTNNISIDAKLEALKKEFQMKLDNITMGNNGSEKLNQLRMDFDALAKNCSEKMAKFQMELDDQAANCSEKMANLDKKCGALGTLINETLSNITKLETTLIKIIDEKILKATGEIMGNITESLTNITASISNATSMLEGKMTNLISKTANETLETAKGLIKNITGLFDTQFQNITEGMNQRFGEEANKTIGMITDAKTNLTNIIETKTADILNQTLTKTNESLSKLTDKFNDKLSKLDLGILDKIKILGTDIDTQFANFNISLTAALNTHDTTLSQMSENITGLLNIHAKNITDLSINLGTLQTELIDIRKILPDFKSPFFGTGRTSASTDPKFPDNWNGLENLFAAGIKENLFELDSRASFDIFNNANQAVGISNFKQTPDWITFLDDPEMQDFGFIFKRNNPNLITPVHIDGKPYLVYAMFAGERLMIPQTNLAPPTFMKINKTVFQNLLIKFNIMPTKYYFHPSLL